MVRYIFLISMIFSIGFSSIRINSVVGDEIDSCEARYYRLFRDVKGFVSAHFYAYEKSDSVQVEMFCLVDSAPVITHRNVDGRILRSIDYYTLNFRKIIENNVLREEFVKDQIIDWPMVTPYEIQKISDEFKAQRIMNSACCITGVTASAAYLGAVMGKSTHQHTKYVSCLEPGGETGCVTTTFPIEYDVYTVDKNIYLVSTAVGFGAAYLLSNALYKRNILSEALKRNIAAFDDQGMPITNLEIKNENQGYYALIYGTLGCVAGAFVSAITIIGLFKPWSEEPDNDLEFTIVTVPIMTISAVEGLALIKTSINQGRKLDRLSTIERIKRKRNQGKK